MKLIKIISCTVIIGVLVGLAHDALAWPDYQWRDTSGNNEWTNVVNWINLDGNTNGFPQSDPSGPAVQIDPVNGSTTCILPPGLTVDLDYENPTAYYNTVYGPEFGEHLNIFGTLEYGWMMAPVQTDPTPANRTIINLYTNSVLQTQGAGIGIGYPWWWFYAGPYVTMNMYANARINVPNCAVGGHLNIYDTATANVTAAVFTGGINCLSDGTASLNLGGGSLILPTGWTNETVQPNNTVYDLIQRGVLRTYGKGEDTNDLVINDNGTNTFVTPVPLGGALLRVYFQPLLQANVNVGTFQQLTLDGDYPSVGGVLLSSAEPGLDPATFSTPVYSSSNPNVATIDANGMVTAVGNGTAQLSATVGALHSTNTLTITVAPVVPTLVHRYSFSAVSGSDVPDSVGGADGTLNGGYAQNGGEVTFDGSSGYVQLPAGILTGLNQVTIETWASFAPSINAWADLCAFGNSELAGNGENYITMQPHTGVVPATAQIGFGQGDPGNAGERDAFFTGTLDGQTNMQVVVVYNPLAGSQTLYTNGVLAATVSMFNNLIDPVAFNGPLFAHQSILPFTLGADPINYIGHSLYSADPTLNGSITEFRIYNTPLTASQIAADYALGPNQVIGTSTASVSLAVSRSGGNVMFSWPTTSAAVTLLTSPALGPTAVWTPVTLPLGAMTVSGGNYQVTLPASAAVQFFRLSN
jgi:hypothetical protein